MLRLGPVQLSTPLLLAPIAGYCDLAFRTIVREFTYAQPGEPAHSGLGVGLACTDLLSPQGLLRGTETSLDLARTNDFDKPVGMQLYGADPELMAEGARWAVEHGATVVDINMGCPVDKVTKKDGGSKLLTDLSRAVRIAERVVKELEKCPLAPEQWSRRLGNTERKASGHQGIQAPGKSQNSMPGCLDASMPSSSPVPLTCKMRLCWSTDDYHTGQACSPHLARMLADVGVVGVTVHGRTTEMKFSGDVIRPGIARVVEAVNGQIPVIGNGDVRTPEDVITMMRETGCQGVMIGRAALSTPWIFRDAWALMSGGVVPPAPEVTEQMSMIRRYFDLMREYRGDHYAMVQIRRRVTWFAKRLPPCKPFKEALRTSRDPAVVYEALERFAAGGLRSSGREIEPEPLVEA